MCKPVVAHSVSCWLPLTMSWVYNQLKYAEGFDSIVLTRSIQNIDQFPWKFIYSERGIFEKISGKIMRRLNVKPYPLVFDSAINLHSPSILHSHFADQGWYDLPIVKKYMLKHIVTFYGYDVNMLPSQQPVWKDRYQEMFEKVDLFFCEGTHMANAIIELGCPVSKVMVQKLGVELENIPFVLRKIVADSDIKILIAGTFREKKGIPYALEAIGRLKVKYPSLRVTLIGDSSGLDKDEVEKLKILNLIKQHDLAPITRLLGFLTHDLLMEEAYGHHIFLSPSVTSIDGDTEGGAPVAIIEMAASGMLVVSTLHCDIPFVLGEKNRSILVAERNVEEIERVIVELIEGTVVVRDNMAHDNRQYIEFNHDIKSCTKSIGRIYSSILQ